MNQSQRVLLEAIKASVFDVEPNYPKETNWNDVVEEAKSQTVLSLISPSIPVTNESFEKCKAFYMRIMYEQDHLVKLLNSGNIPFVILKGSAASKYYPKPYLRVMGDIDILVSRGSFFESIKILESNGYINEHSSLDDNLINESTREVEYTKNGIIIELHQSFSSPGVDVDDILDDAINRRQICNLSSYSFPMLPEIENGLVLLGHINQHLKNNVLGLRQIIDWQMYIHSITDKALWVTQFNPIADKIGLLSLAAYVTSMCNKYLGLPDKLSFGIDVDETLTGELLEVILTDGNFGRRVNVNESAEEKSVRSASYYIKQYGFFVYFTKVGQNNSDFCKKHPSLSLFAFIIGLFRQFVRGIYLLINKQGIGKKMDEGKRRFELYKKLGVRMETK